MSFVEQPLACVMGDMDLVRPLGLSRIKCAVAVQPGAAPRYSRFTKAVVDWTNPWDAPETMVENLIRFGQAQSEKPILFFESDAELLMISRNRKRLQHFFRFAIADQNLVEDLVDKERFQKMAEEMNLPVPRARRLKPNEKIATELDLNFPIVVKPLTRRPQSWKAVTAAGKAVRVNSVREVEQLWPSLSSSGVDVLAQELIPGPETSIESYHVYVNGQGDIVGEFTGRKIRTYPKEYGDSTALEITAEVDVLSLGRDVVKRLDLRGVAKLDFKRNPNGKLFLLEINPRFNLWHHLGALAGVNLPALVYADLTGQPVQKGAVAKAGMSWCRIWQDVLSAREEKLSLARWLRWSASCEAKRLLSWDDPMPFIGACAWHVADKLKTRFRRDKSSRHRFTNTVITSDAA